MTVTGGTVVPRRRLRTKVRLDPSLAAAFAAPSVPSASSSAKVCAPCTWDGFVCKERNAEYCVVKEAFTPQMLEKLGHFLSRKRPKPAKMKNEGAGDSDDERKARYDDRDSMVSWFDAEAECRWLHNRLEEVIQKVGNVEWPLLKADGTGKLECEFEQTQYSVYGPNQHFQAWHQDAFADGNDPEDARQLTIVAMLSKKSAYTGGLFQAKLKDPVTKNKKVLQSIRLDAGDVLVFPAKELLHRVGRVKTGTRKTLVFWAFDRASCKYHTVGAGAEVDAGAGILGAAKP
mmetsp:Transcript_24531/g.63805  ORF Transcript_24531/g.63805 Transcript_24531/m.63805 type:complete len:288 (+) Transcript_24531:2-865(+)